MDFIELMPEESKKFCLVMVYMMFGWSEVFPSSDANTQAVVKSLLINVFPTFWILEHNEPERGCHLIPTAIQ